MNASRAIWVETSSFDASEGAEPDLFPRLQQRILWRGVFACQVYFRPFEELDRFRHGFNLDTLLNEALDRLRLFIETQHFPGQVDDAYIPYSQRRALALRCVNCAEPGRLTLVVMGRVYGAGEEEACENGRRACREICSIFPYDYQVVPIETGAEFERLTGAQVIRSLKDPAQAAGIERFEGFMDTGYERAYISGAWSNSLAGNEQIWRTLGGIEAPTVYNVTLQPVIVHPDELAAMQNLGDFLSQNTPQIKAALIRQVNELALQRCSALLKNGRRAYLGQTRLMSAAPLAEYAPRAIGFGLTRQPEAQPAAPGFQVSRPNSPDELNHWKRQALALTPIPNEDMLERRFVWRSELMLLEEATALFRPPYPLRRELPGARLNFLKEDGHG